eukprot:CAMPEP_0182526262 /NCGR_PEP_ID=MMETSP1323-20130603/3055_1 /TAXON_ID=236787 /ORGANISM="Florenciella parvula, Strain RCC1693" /LENGTH=173 /DNA_ID=CAMNT_0024735085 /DNA_START=123 /DNA_END=639 /DNA_ORIENTATION=-
MYMHDDDGDDDDDDDDDDSHTMTMTACRMLYALCSMLYALCDARDVTCGCCDLWVMWPVGAVACESKTNEGSPKSTDRSEANVHVMHMRRWTARFLSWLPVVLGWCRRSVRTTKAPVAGHGALSQTALAGHCGIHCGAEMRWGEVGCRIATVPQGTHRTDRAVPARTVTAERG